MSNSNFFDLAFFNERLSNLQNLLQDLGVLRYGNLDDIEASIMSEIPTVNDSNIYIKIFYRGITLRFKVIDGTLELILAKNIVDIPYSDITEVVIKTIKEIEDFKLPLHYIKFPVKGEFKDINITKSGFIEGEYNVILS